MSSAPPAGLRRSLDLFRAFRVEQSDPAHFYTTLAADSVRQMRRWVDLRGSTVLDVGGGPGYFARAFEDEGAGYFPVEVDEGEFGRGEQPAPRAVVGSGISLPFRDGAFDVAYSSNVLEHVRDPGLMVDEMVRVTRPGGATIISYTTWWGPWGGHETAPWHLLGGHRARERYRRRHGREPKNRFGETLFPVTVAQGRALGRSAAGASLVAAVPRYLPTWAESLPRIPVVGELMTWNLLLVLRRHYGATS